ncbi:Uncharacterised protein [Mycobacteroides abscessus subsp. abscessus]|nr:Uncharacterised protein [Mycobacteroides abscessus subsp. abscessus]
MGAKTTYGPLSSTLVMFTAGFRPPDTAELNVLIAGIAASTWLTGLLTNVFRSGMPALTLSQPGPWGSTVLLVGGGSGGGSA